MRRISSGTSASTRSTDSLRPSMSCCCSAYVEKYLSTTFRDSLLKAQIQTQANKCWGKGKHQKSIAILNKGMNWLRQHHFLHSLLTTLSNEQPEIKIDFDFWWTFTTQASVQIWGCLSCNSYLGTSLVSYFQNVIDYILLVTWHLKVRRFFTILASV